MKVFISHAKRDGQLAKRLRDELEHAGFDVRPDDPIYPGDNWAKITGQALEQADVMIALVTRNALESSPLTEDVQFALTTSRNYRGRVVPVMVDLKTFDEGDVPWILLRLNPVYIESVDSDLHGVIDRVISLAEPTSNVAG